LAHIMGKEKFKHFMYRYVLPYGGLLLVKIIALTYRVKILDPQNESNILKHDNSLIYASWHQRFFPGITFFAKRKPIAIIISQSRDGDFISHMVDLLGWYPVRGSSSRGGSEALRRVKELALGGYKIGHIVDGPRGPFGVIKPGLLRIAQIAGKPVVPTITSAQKKWVFSSWDKFIVPKPFSRIIIRFGEPIYIPLNLDENEFEKKRRLIEQTLKDLYDDTDRIWDCPAKVNEIFKSNSSPCFRTGHPGQGK
jgi:lysophospholipid acyltransferase (LPLAT)-like uncharacterized protein